MKLGVSKGRVQLLHVVQGAVGVTDDPSVVYTALLGSCVAVCAHDTVAGLGGMAHFQFPGAGGDSRFGGVAVDDLIQRLKTLGAQPGRLSVKLFGGARMHEGLHEMGGRNVDFVQKLLADMAVQVVDCDLGKDAVRRITYRPCSGESSIVIQPQGMPIAAMAG